MFPRKKHDPEFLEAFEKLMTQETERMLELTQRFLERSKVDLERKTVVDWDPLVERVLELMGPVFQEQGTELEVKKGTGISIRGAACQLESLVLNLVRNGLESAGPKGKVKVSSRPKAPFLEFQVWNDGKPIPRPLMKEIFKPFFSTKKDGTGLGLAICQWVVENHGGRIEARSSASGTVFQVLIPLKSSPSKRKGRG
jgi:signal transduction histidine kinase